MAHPQSSVAEEQTPLLANNTNLSENPKGPHQRKVIVLSFLLFFLYEIGAGLSIPSTNAALEDRICRDIFPDRHDGLSQLIEDDMFCKHPNVQGRLAMIRGWQTTLDCIPGLLTTVLYGILADKWGRKKVLALSVLGLILSMVYQFIILYFHELFPTEAMLSSFVFCFIGGSPSVTSAMLYTMLADVVPVAMRATVFLQFTTIMIISEIVSSPLAGIIMIQTTWGTMVIGIMFLCLSMSIIIFMPETLELVVSASSPRLSDPETAEPTPYSGHPSTGPRSRSVTQSLYETWGFLQNNRKLAFLILSLVFAVLSRFVQEMLLQYTTKRYSWTWSRAAFVLTIRSVANLVVLTVILPTAAQFCLVKMKWSSLKKDLWLARVSGLIGICGALLISFAFEPYILCIGLVIFALGGGTSSLIRSLLNSLVDPRHTGLMNTLIGMTEILGIMIAAPILSSSLKLGLNIGGPWIGLPFLCAAVIIAISTSIVWLFEVPGTRK